LTLFPAQFYNPFVKGIYCQECNHKRNEMVCPRCGHIFVLIQFNHDNEKFALYHDKTGRAYTYSQAELDKREIDTQRKNKSFRPEDWRTLSDRACELIAQAIGNETDAERFVFINPATGRGYLPELTRRLWRSNTTVSEDLYSSTRHSLATQLGEDGVPKKYIQEIMGHKDGRSTDVYIHPSDRRKKEYLNSRSKVIDIKKKKTSG